MFSSNPCRLPGLAALLLLFAVPSVNAQTTFLPSDTTLDASNPIPGSAIVGYANFPDFLSEINGTSPTISIVTGGSIANDLQVFNSSIVNMSGGDVGAGFGIVTTFDSSTFKLSGGTVEIDLNTQNNSKVNFSGGTIGDDLVTVDNSTVTMSGGTIGHALLTNGNSIFNLRGGTILDNIFIQDSSLLNVFGIGLSSTLIDPNFMGFYSEYSLSGLLEDKTDLAGRTIFIQNGSGASFTLNNDANLVPEPGAFASFLVGAAFCGGGLLLSQKRKRGRCVTAGLKTTL